MPTLSKISSLHQEYLIFKHLQWFPEAANHKGLARGGVYLLSGQEGSGKSTLALQMGVDLACLGHKVLYVTLEMTPETLKEWIEERIFPHRRAESEVNDKLGWQDGLRKVRKGLETNKAEERIENNFWIDSTVSGMEHLPDFLTRQVLGGRQYAGTELIIVDSLQGLGTAPTSSKPYQRLFEFNRWAKDHGITILLIGHITKGGAVAGPRSLQHNVDSVLYLRKAMRFRPLFVPKNRFGPERHEPLTLVVDKWGCLEKSKHASARASRAFGYLPGHEDFIEVQALVKLPKYGERPGLKAPYLPKAKLSQLVGIASSLRETDISDLTFEINCAIPGGRPYSLTLDLALLMSMLASYFQRPIPAGSLFVGEVDLMQDIRPIPPGVCSNIARLLGPSEGGTASNLIQRVFISERNIGELQERLVDNGTKMELKGVTTLEAPVATIWPDSTQTD